MISSGRAASRRMLGDLWLKMRRRDSGLFGLWLGYSVVAALYPLLGVLLPRLLIEQLGQAGVGTSQALQMAVIRNVGLILAGFLVLAATLGGLTTYLLNLSYARLAYLRLDYLRDFSQKILTMDFRLNEDAAFMDRTSRVNRAVQSNRNGIEDVYRQLFTLPAKLLAGVLLLVVLALAEPLLLILPLMSFLAILYAQNRSDAYRFAQREKETSAMRRLYLFGEISSNFTYGKDIRLFNLKGLIFSAYDKMIADAAQLVRQAARKEFNHRLLPILIQTASSVATMGVLLHRALAGSLSVAEFVFFLSAHVTFIVTVEEIAVQINRIGSEGRYVKELLGFLAEDLNQNSGAANLQPAADEQEKTLCGQDERTTDQVEVRRVAFQAVTFCYPGSNVPVVENLNLTLDAGEKLALVGVNGAGKSTLVKLMTGLHHPTSGAVLINGQDTRTLNPQSLFQAFSVVFQSEEPIAFTVAEHVAGRAAGVDRERVKQALARVGLLDKVEAHPDGIDTTLLKVIDKDGLMLSGGETQKLMLARALYKDAPVIVLDEPTAALDALAETRVYQEFAETLSGRTGLFISHRLASTSFCDRIVLLSGGRIAEAGTHEELMRAKGAYYEMFMTQGKYYQDEAEQDG